MGRSDPCAGRASQPTRLRQERRGSAASDNERAGCAFVRGHLRIVASIVSSCSSCTLDATPDTIPLLQFHYRTINARTDRSAPVLYIGTFASWLRPLVLFPLH